METELRSSVEKLSRDLRVASATLTNDEARFLVDAYYTMQADRIRANNQVRQMDTEPHDVLGWLATQSTILEKSVHAALDVYSAAHSVGARMRTVRGVGPVIAAGLLAHIDITRAPTAGAIWRFAGLNPDLEWKKGQKRPFNASLKTLCWKLGESFVKVSNHEDAFYGQLYKERKDAEIAKNEAGDFADQAKAKLEKFKISKTTDAHKAYAGGKLPPAHIHARAKRYAVKMFLSHLHEIWHKEHYGVAPPAPYVMVHAGHVHKLEPPF